MRSALAGTASNVVAVKTAAAVPMSVIERMFHLRWLSGNQRWTITRVPRDNDHLNFDTHRTFFEFLAEHFLNAISPGLCTFDLSATNDPPHALQKIEPPIAALRFPFRATTKGESRMDREHVKGTAEKVKGTIEDTAGKVTDDKKLQTEGKFDKAKGSAHKVVGDIKDAVKQSNK
jgi:uncharacterized protein YjbJ (UPF0337 family)